MAARFVPAGDASVLVVLGDAIGPRESARVHAWLRALQQAPPPWLLDLHPAYASVLVEFDLHAVAHDEVQRWLHALEPGVAEEPEGRARVLELPVCYGGAEGPDLQALAAHAHLDVDEVVRRHAAATYTVAFLGFEPGFAYLLGLPPELAMPRRASPRPRVPAGSVAIAGAQAGVYPAESPGGWQLLGSTRVPLGEGWARPGDRVRFVVERGAP